MLHIETSGSWRAMGEQVGRAFGKELCRLRDRFLAFFPKDPVKMAAASAAVRRTAQSLCPELLEETAGMAAGAGLDEESLFRYRFYVDIRASARQECSSLFALDAAGTPWLGRTCDIEPEDHWAQICHIRRPKDGVAALCLTYLGMAVGVGMNAHGVGLVGGSATSRKTYGHEGSPCSLLMHKALHTARNLVEVREIFLKQPTLGKGGVLLVGDASGASSLFEVAPGRRMNPIARASEATWQGCTNFYCSGKIQNADMPPYLYNAYARYGLLSHRLGGKPGPHAQEQLQQLLADVSQPGSYIPKGACPLETAYAALLDLKHHTAYLAEGNPNHAPFQKITL